MDFYTATEEAYKRGYQDGLREANPQIDREVRGEWLNKFVMYRHPGAKNYFCSECKEETNYCTNYCPCCGAKMNGGN